MRCMGALSFPFFLLYSLPSSTYLEVRLSLYFYLMRQILFHSTLQNSGLKTTRAQAQEVPL